jgi:ring-1,2-phenylacetyl-CoA epoxidase subunit PaaE
MASFYKLKIDNITRETSNAISISFSVPEELKKTYQFTAGQYVTLKLTLDGNEIRRAYSICSSPSSGELRVAIKEVENGLFSTFANRNLQVGDILEVGQPEGNFIFNPASNTSSNYAAFVAGSGITPVFSILTSVLESEPNSTFVLIYGNKSKEDTIFFNALEALQHKFVGRIFVHYVFSQSALENSISGRINASVVQQVIKETHQNKEFKTFYLCGPEEMIQTVTSALKEKGVAEENIKFELFTSTATENKDAGSHSGQTKITVIVDGETTHFEMNQKDTLLDASLKKGIDAPYSCQGGVCSSCLARITKGSAEMKKNSILTDQEIAEGLTLTCQAHPTSAEIEVDFDDV